MIRNANSYHLCFQITKAMKSHQIILFATEQILEFHLSLFTVVRAVCYFLQCKKINFWIIFNIFNFSTISLSLHTKFPNTTEFSVVLVKHNECTWYNKWAIGSSLLLLVSDLHCLVISKMINKMMKYAKSIQLVLLY